MPSGLVVVASGTSRLEKVPPLYRNPSVLFSRVQVPTISPELLIPRATVLAPPGTSIVTKLSESARAMPLKIAATLQIRRGRLEVLMSHYGLCAPAQYAWNYTKSSNRRHCGLTLAAWQ